MATTDPSKFGFTGVPELGDAIQLILWMERRLPEAYKSFAAEEVKNVVNSLNRIGEQYG